MKTAGERFSAEEVRDIRLEFIAGEGEENGDNFKRSVLELSSTLRNGGAFVRIRNPSPLDRAPELVVLLPLASVIGAAVASAITAFINNRNGRKLKIKVGDIEVEATQMKEADVLRIFELLEEKADRKKIRELLISESKGEGRPEPH